MPSAMPARVAGAGVGTAVGAVAGVAGAAAAGLPIGLAVATAAVGGVLGMVAGARRRATGGGRAIRRSAVDPFAVGDPWRQDVTRALRARDRYRAAVQDVPGGPLRERLAGIGERIEEGVEAAWRTARRGYELQRAHVGPTAGDLAARAAELEAMAAADDDPTAEQAAAAARAQHASVARIDAAAADAHRRLTLLTARLDEAATRAVELAAGVGGAGDVDADVDAVVEELESLRRALEEL